jgi:hypothetical protein
MESEHLEIRLIKQQIERHRQNLDKLISRHHSLTHPDVVKESQAIDQLLNRLNRLKNSSKYYQAPIVVSEQTGEDC